MGDRSSSVLLTPSESNAFSSFLSALDNLEPDVPLLSAEWSMYAKALSNQQLPKAREDLARATKDLIGSLDMPNSGAPSSFSSSAPRHPRTTVSAHDLHIPSSFLHGSRNWPNQGVNPSWPAPSPSPISPSVDGRDPMGSSMFKLSSSHSSSSSSITACSLMTLASAAPAPPPPTRKRPSLDVHPPVASSSRSSKRQKSDPTPLEKSHSKRNPSEEETSRERSSLLSAKQKKLNHIQSEQKRRANIRKGYDALCDAVPPLREAIQAEDAACASSGRKRGRGKLLGEDGEKLDGRAGPRSESVVLQKTIEYVTDLMGERDMLLERLDIARARLRPGHPALMTEPAEKPWERVWNGGIGLPLNGDFEQEGDEDAAGSDEGD